MKDDSDSEKRQQIHHIKNLFAFNLFCQKRFDESMQVFAKLGTGKCLGSHRDALVRRNEMKLTDCLGFLFSVSGVCVSFLFVCF